MTIRTINMSGKIGYGILLPAAIFLAYQFVSIEATRGDGTWAGKTLFFGWAWNERKIFDLISGLWEKSSEQAQEQPRAIVFLIPERWKSGAALLDSA